MSARDITNEDLCATCAHLQCGEKKGYPNASPDLWHAQSECVLNFPVSRVDMNVITGCQAYVPPPLPLPLPARSTEDMAVRIAELEAAGRLLQSALRALVYAGNACGACVVPLRKHLDAGTTALNHSQKVL